MEVNVSIETYTTWLKNKQITADELGRNGMVEGLDISVTERTIWSYLYETGFRRCRRRENPNSDNNREKRL